MAWRDAGAAGGGPLALLTASFGAGRLLGVEVRVYWLTLVLLPVIGLVELGRLGLAAGELWTDVLLLTVLLYGVVLAHEMGHVLAARRYGVWTPLVTLSPLGGLAHLATPVPHPRADVVVSLAGPATHLLWLLPLWLLTRVVDPAWLRPAGWAWGAPYFAVDFLWQVNLGLFFFNLLPFFPLDGGRVLRAALAARMPVGHATRIAARVGQVGAVGFVVYGLTREGLWGTVLVLVGISCFVACVQELRAARYHVTPYDTRARAPWEDDADAWKRGGVGAGGPRRDGPLARWRSRRAQRAASRQRADAEALERDLDRVLARVSEVGMAGLTKAERHVLERASRARRGS